MLIEDKNILNSLILKIVKVILFGGILGLLVIGGGKANAGVYLSGYIYSTASQVDMSYLYYLAYINKSHVENGLLVRDLPIFDTKNEVPISYDNRFGQDLTNLEVGDVEVLDGEAIIPHNAYTFTGSPAWLHILINAGQLAVGNHVITVKPKGFTDQKIEIIVVSNNTKLNNLSLSSGNLNETFDAGQTDYTQSLDSTVTSLTVTPIVADSMANVTVQANNGEYVAIANGQASGAVSLVNGINYIRTKVTAQSGISNTYVVTVTRPSTITKSVIAGVTKPVTGAIPVAAIAATAEYTAAIAWLPASSAYSGNTGYTAMITITPQAGFSLNGVGANFFRVPGATTTNAAGSGVVKAVFPPTGAAAAALITTSAITGVTAPVAGVAPVTAIAATTDYTATIAWSPTSSTFIADGLKIYTATITITPKAGYTLTGVGENFFKVVGAITTNAAGSGVVRAVFPATAPAPIAISAIERVTAPRVGAKPVATAASTLTYTAVIAWSPAAATFAGNTAYTATITITPKAGYTLAGVAANFFTVAGATTTNAAGSGVVTAVFPATGPSSIASTAIAGVTAPVTGVTPTATIAAATEYTAAITWSPAAATFAGNTAYTATITITPKAGYTLAGVGANFFTVAGATTTNAAGSGVVTAVFPATGPASIASPVIAGVTAPVTGAAPAATIAAATEYTATITWSPAAATFAGNTAYTATITITPKAGYTLAGVGANFFKVAGATTTHAAGSGVVTAVFPATGPSSIASLAIAGATAPVTGAVPAATIAAATEYTASITWSPAAATFAGNTAYTATITITPKAGYTLAGVGANFFTIAGAATANAVGSGVVTAVFPATPVLTGFAAVNAATSTAAVQALLESTDNQTEFGLTMDDYWTLAAASRLGIATAVFRGGMDYTTAAEIKTAFDAAVMDAAITVQPAFTELSAAAARDVATVQTVLETKYSELGLTMNDYNHLSSESKTAVATSILNRPDFNTAAEIEAIFDAEVTAQPVVVSINEATSAVQVQTLLNIPENQAALGLEFMDYYSALVDSGKLYVATAIFNGKLYTTSDSLEEVFNQEVSIQKMINDMNKAATTDEMIGLLIVNQNLLGLNLTTFDGRTAVAAAMMSRRPYSTAAEIKAAFITDFTAQIIATINLATSAAEVQSLLQLHYADFGILNIGSMTFYGFYNSYLNSYLLSENQGDPRLAIAAYVFNDGADYTNVASIKARFDAIAATYLP